MEKVKKLIAKEKKKWKIYKLEKHKTRKMEGKKSCVPW